MRCSLCFVLLLSAGCSAPMSTFHTGRTTPRNRVEAVTGVGLNVASSFIGAVLDSGKVAADKASAAITTGSTPSLSDDEKRDLMRAAFSYALMSPLPLYEVGLRYGILDRWDAGVAYTTSGFRFETKVQLLRRSEKAIAQGRSTMPFDLAIGAQALHQVFKIPLPDFLKDVFEIDDFSRTDLTFPLIASRHFGHYGFLYGGLRFSYSILQADVLEKISDVAGKRIESGRGMWSLGGIVGGGIGYKYVFLVLELNVLYYDYGATLLDTKVNLSGVDVYPLLGLKINFYGPRKY